MEIVFVVKYLTSAGKQQMNVKCTRKEKKLLQKKEASQTSIRFMWKQKHWKLVNYKNVTLREKNVTV